MADDPLEGKNPHNGHFAAGNRFWEARASCGPKPKFAKPDDLWNACVEYFKWVDDNPLIEKKLVSFQGVSTIEALPKMRAMTIGALCTFLDIRHATWNEWRKSRDDLADVIEKVDAVIFAQKFEGAAADMLNGSIIARDLGLADKREHTGAGGGPIQTVTTSMTPQEAAEAYAATLHNHKG